MPLLFVMVYSSADCPARSRGIEGLMDSIVANVSPKKGYEQLLTPMAFQGPSMLTPSPQRAITRYAIMPRYFLFLLPINEYTVTSAGHIHA
jgi:hypothetical protein